jgi:hypothetical protein
MARPMRLAREACESCGDHLDPNGYFVQTAAGRPVLKRMLCAACVVDTVQRQQAEARQLAAELELMWTVDITRTDTDGPDEPDRRVPVP